MFRTKWEIFVAVTLRLLCKHCFGLYEMHSNAKQLLIIVYANMMFAYKQKCPAAADPLY